MQIHELNKDDEIWFKYPNATISFPAKVIELEWNFEGEPIAKTRVGTEIVYIDDNFDIVKV
ncbi:hypothetical protein [Staphylococcus simiae]|uniref:Uncharacterized protein n=1 Tax=Staphylococcus simiae CCM 7213 = CCUG 51256 TaxID=911238 RepID=G5JH65_9STAP|nr:hypothetical protein SS7213T_03970 [Staphylococcus simiae CCM 7213 = CCUG 51256]